MIGKAAFSQWEADLSIYLSDAFGNVSNAAPVWLGGTTNKSNFQDGYEAEKANISGVPVQAMQKLEEKHVLEIENVWMARVEDGPLVSAPVNPRNQYYAVVAIWTDRETGVWIKRVYAGVQLMDLSMSSDSQVFQQKLKIEGGVMQQTGGVLSLSVPSEEPVMLGIVRYVSPTETMDLYTFDFRNPRAGFQAINPGLLAGRATIVDGGLQIIVAGNSALSIVDGQVIVNALTGIGGSYVEDATMARLEFIGQGNVRMAALSGNGELGVPGFFECDDDPTLSAACMIPAFTLGGDEWLATIAPDGLFAGGIAVDS